MHIEKTMRTLYSSYGGTHLQYSMFLYFFKYLEQEGGQALLEFWISAFNFKQHLQKQQGSKTYNPEEAQADAMVLYDK